MPDAEPKAPTQSDYDAYRAAQGKEPRPIEEMGAAEFSELMLAPWTDAQGSKT